MAKQYLQQRMQPVARWALMPLIRLHLAPLHEEQEVLSVLRNRPCLTFFMPSWLSELRYRLHVLGLVVLFFVGCWVALVLSCYVQPV